METKLKSGLVYCIRKSKKPKRKGLVLFHDRLDVYEEKSFKKMKQCERSLLFESVFHFSKSEQLLDGKQIGDCLHIFTEVDQMSFYVESNVEVDDWYRHITLALANPPNPQSLVVTMRHKFDYVWDLIIDDKEGLGKTVPGLAGPRRMALSLTSVFLLAKDKLENLVKENDILEYPLVYISNYGVKGTCFQLKTGTWSVTGQGEIFMDTQDLALAKHIYQILDNRCIDNREAREERERSLSNVDRTRVGTWTTRNTRERSGSSSLQPKTRIRALSESEKKLQSLCLAALSREPSTAPRFVRNTDSAAMKRRRFRGASESEGHPSPLLPVRRQTTAPRPSAPAPVRKISAPATSSFASYFSLRARLSEQDYNRRIPTLSNDSLTGGAMTPPLTASWTTHHGASLIPCAAFCSTDSVGSSSSVDNEAHAGRIRHTVSSGVRSPSTELCSPPTIAEECACEYTTMDSPHTKQHFREDIIHGDYIAMEKQNTEADPVYTAMLSPQPADVPEAPAKDDYTKMGPKIEQAHHVHSRQQSWNLEEIHSYISDSDSCYSSLTGTAGGYLPPTRAMSLGSGIRPRPVSSIPETTCLDTVSINTSTDHPVSMDVSLVSSFDDSLEDRKRAHSVGSGWKVPPRKTSAAVSSLLHPTPDKCRPRSDSYGSGDLSFAHFLLRRSNTPSPGRSTPLNKRTSELNRGKSVGAHSEDLMEIDFGTSPIGPSESGSLFGSNDSMPRSRTSSFGTSFLKTSSHPSSTMHWCPKVANIREREQSSPPKGAELSEKKEIDLNGLESTAPSAKLIARYFHDQAKHMQESPSDYAAMHPPTTSTPVHPPPPMKYTLTEPSSYKLMHPPSTSNLPLHPSPPVKYTVTEPSNYKMMYPPTTSTPVNPPPPTNYHVMEPPNSKSKQSQLIKDCPSDYHQMDCIPSPSTKIDGVSSTPPSSEPLLAVTPADELQASNFKAKCSISDDCSQMPPPQTDKSSSAIKGGPLCVTIPYNSHPSLFKFTFSWSSCLRRLLVFGCKSDHCCAEVSKSPRAKMFGNIPWRGSPPMCTSPRLSQDKHVNTIERLRQLSGSKDLKPEMNSLSPRVVRKLTPSEKLVGFGSGEKSLLEPCGEVEYADVVFDDKHRKTSSSSMSSSEKTPTTSQTGDCQTVYAEIDVTKGRRE